MPAEACSAGFVFAATVNRYDTQVHSRFITGVCVLNILSPEQNCFQITFLVNLAAGSVQPREQTIECTHSPRNAEEKSC